MSMRTITTLIENIVSLAGLLFLILIGAILLVAGNWTRMSAQRDLGRMVQATGVVVDLVASRDSEGGGYVYSPMIEFVPVETGVPVRFEQSIRQSENLAPKRGARIEVLYDPEDPQQARVNSFIDLWMLPIALIGSGAVVILLGIVFLLRAVVRLGRGRDTGVSIDL
jgi:hypothetical protein